MLCICLLLLNIINYNILSFFLLSQLDLMSYHLKEISCFLANGCSGQDLFFDFFLLLSNYGARMQSAKCYEGPRPVETNAKIRMQVPILSNLDLCRLEVTVIRILKVLSNDTGGGM